MHTISPNSAFPIITDPVVIDGYTQPGSSANTLADGDNAVLLVELNGGRINSTGIHINSSNCVVRGLVINRFNNAGIFFSSSVVPSPNTNNVVEGNFIGTDPSGTISLGNDDGIQISFSTNNLIGGTNPAARNVISGNGSKGVFIGTGARGNLIQGNFIGTNASGTTPLSNNGGGVFSGGLGNDTIGGTTAGARNVISGNLNMAGIMVQSENGATIQGNLVGTDVTGTRALGNSFGIWLNSGSGGNSMIGGGSPAARNVISGNRSDGLFITGSERNNQIQGNLIGTDVSGTMPLGNSANGIRLDSFAANNGIGGTGLGQGNTIAFNGHNGVLINGGSSNNGNALRGNAIFSNAGLGIDLGDAGVTQNDAGDGDSGPNNSQNFPMISSIDGDSSQTTITGTLNSTPNTAFTVNFYSNSACDPSGNGEGASPFGITSTTVTTDASGNGSFAITLPIPLAPGRVVTATATDPLGNTSEFSPCDSSKAMGNAQLGSASYTVIEDVGFVTVTVNRVGGSFGTLAVDYTTTDITSTAGQDYTAISGILTFADGEVTKTLDIPILDDAVSESDESLAVLLRSPSNPDSIGNPNTAVLTIRDHSALPVLSLNNVSVSEGNTGTTNAVFTVSLQATSRTVTVNYSSLGSTAISGVDFQPVSGSLTFNPRVTTQTISVPVISDALDEVDEMFQVQLTGPINAEVANSGIGTIIDDDPLPSVSISDVSIHEGNSGTTTAFFTVSLSVQSGRQILVGYATANGTASVSDYLAAGGFLNFNPGETSKTVAISVNGDTENEGDETFFVNLTFVPNVNVARG